MDGGAWWAIVHGVSESETTECVCAHVRVHTHTHTHTYTHMENNTSFEKFQMRVTGKTYGSIIGFVLYSLPMQVCARLQGEGTFSQNLQYSTTEHTRLLCPKSVARQGPRGERSNMGNSKG